MRKKRSPRAHEITLQDVIAHIQGVKNELVTRIDRLEKRMGNMENGFAEVNHRLAALQSSIAAEQRMRRTQTENIVERLDDIEIRRLPRLEKKVFS